MANPLLMEKERNLRKLKPFFFFYQSVGLVGKSLSTLIATTLQHSSSCRRSHSFTESVYFASLSFLGLVSSFHSLSPANIAIFFYFLGVIATFPTITFPIISQKDKPSQAILSAFSFFILILFSLRARSHG